MAQPDTNAERYEVLIRYAESFCPEEPGEGELRLIASILPEILKTMQRNSELSETEE